MAKAIPPCLTALGRESLPAEIEVSGSHYVQRHVFKNDFFAVTAMYEGEAGRILLKVGRQASFLLVPLTWVGRLLAAREEAALRRLDDLEGVPRFIGRWGSTGIIREFIDGHHLVRREHVGDEFHEQLRQLVEEMHRRGMAYVDLEKCENVLVGDDGKPHLIDFQICWHVSAWWGDLWPLSRLRRWLQLGDRYHLRKLQRRTRPDQLTPAQLAASYRKPWHLRLHRFFTWPFTWVRRRVLERLDPRRAPGERGRLSDDEAMGAT